MQIKHASLWRKGDSGGKCLFSRIWKADHLKRVHTSLEVSWVVPEARRDRVLLVSVSPLGLDENVSQGTQALSALALAGSSRCVALSPSTVACLLSSSFSSPVPLPLPHTQLRCCTKVSLPKYLYWTGSHVSGSRLIALMHALFNWLSSSKQLQSSYHGDANAISRPWSP